jgi:hypothetical protein
MTVGHVRPLSRCRWGAVVGAIALGMQPFAALATPHGSLPVSTLAQGQPFTPTINFRPPRPPDVGSPRERRGAGTRGPGCPVVATPLTAVLPVYPTQTVGEVPLSTTLEPYPDLWLYLPYPLTGDRTAELRVEIMGADGVPLQQSLAVLTEVPAGIIALPLADTHLPPLEVGDTLNLMIVVRCNPAEVASNLYVDFTLQRVAPTAQILAAGADPAAYGAALADSGVWVDLLSWLADQQQAQPDNPALTAIWVDLLATAGLGDVASAPVHDCCDRLLLPSEP